MSVRTLKHNRIHWRKSYSLQTTTYYRFTTTKIICQSIRYNSTSLPIPGKKYGNNTKNETTTNTLPKTAITSQTTVYAPWQKRSIVLHDQCCKIPELIIARIESISNAQIEIIASLTPQTDIHNNDNTHSPTLYATTSLLSSFYPSEYYQITISGDQNAVDTAMQLYIYYSQSAIPLALDTKIPIEILDAISKDCGCFIERQNAFVYRIFPTSLDKNDKNNIHEIEKKIRSSIHRLNVPQPWYDNRVLMQLLFNYLKKECISSNLSFKSGGYFWYDSNDDIDKQDDDNDIDIDDDDKIQYKYNGLPDINDEFKDDIGHMWTYQDTDNSSIIDIENELQSFIKEFTEKWSFISLTDKSRSLLAASKYRLWQYIQKRAKNVYNVDVMLSNDSILWKSSDFIGVQNLNHNQMDPDDHDDEPLFEIENADNMDNIGDDNENVTGETIETDVVEKKMPGLTFSEFVKKVLSHMVYMDINIDLNRGQRANLHKLMIDYNLLYIIPDNESFVTYYVNYYATRFAKTIKRSIKNIIDPLYEPQLNTLTEKQKKQQLIHINNSEKFYVIIRMLEYLKQKHIINDIKSAKQHSNSNDNDNSTDNKSNIYYSILQKQQSIYLYVLDDDKNVSPDDNELNGIFDHINRVNSISVPLSILLLLRSNKGQICQELEDEYKVIISAPLLQSIPDIIKRNKKARKNKENKDKDRDKDNDDNEQQSADNIMMSNVGSRNLASIYFWTENDDDYNIQQYFDNILSRKIDIPLPLDLLYRSSIMNKNANDNDNMIEYDNVKNTIETAKYLSSKYNLFGITSHPTKVLQDKPSDKRLLKHFNPKAFEFRYWLFSNKINKYNLDNCINEIQNTLNSASSIDLDNMAPLVNHLRVVTNLKKQPKNPYHELRVYLNVDKAAIYCFGDSKFNLNEQFELFRTDVNAEIDKIRKYCISISGQKYDDIVLFLIEDNWRRIRRVIGSDKFWDGFLWFNNFDKYFNEFEALNIYCKNENILNTIENDVIQNIYNNSKIFYWNNDFNCNYNDYCKNDYLQKKIKNIMKETRTNYAIRGKRLNGPTMAITNYDKYDLDTAHTLLLNLLAPNKNNKTDNKPLIIS